MSFGSHLPGEREPHYWSTVAYPRKQDSLKKNINSLPSLNCLRKSSLTKSSGFILEINKSHNLSLTLRYELLARVPNLGRRGNHP